jgi:hypothetical protein
MKSLALFVCCLLAILSLKAQTNIYHPFPDSNATWSSTYDDINSGSIYDMFYLEGDTIMEGRSYSKIYNFIGWTQRNYVGGIRQDTAAKRIYAKLVNWMYPIYPPSIFLFSDTSDVLLYDFSLEIGDSILIPSIFFYYQYLYVNNIDSIEIQGNYRKYLVLNSSIHPWINSYWIEGIGSLNGLFWPRFDQEFSICNLACMTQEAITLYAIDGAINCPYYPNSIPNIKDDQRLILYPNPVQDYLYLKVRNINSKDFTCEIYDFTGNLIVQKSKISIEQSHIDVSSLKEGIYIIQIEIESQFYNFKFIKSSP